MGSVGGEEEFPAGVMGADAEVGALVWVRRRNGSWWPGRILGQDELPENCVVPPRSAGTPIKLLGRPDGSIDWYNLEKSKRVKAFRCGEYEECIEKAKILARQQKRTYNEGKYVRREDAIMHALEIERSRFPDEDEMDDVMCASENRYSANSRNIGGASRISSRVERGLYDIEENSAQGLSEASTFFKLPQNISSSSTRYASSSRKKRKASNKFEDDTVKGFRRMRDLIGSNRTPKRKSSAGSFSHGYHDLPHLESGPSFGYELPSTNGINKNKQSHSLTKRKRSNIGQAYENSRKKDKRRPLSKLCKDSAVKVPTYWDASGQSSVQSPGHKLSNVFESNWGGFSLPGNLNCSYSSGTSSVETLADALCTSRSGATKASKLKEAEVFDGTGFLSDGCSDDDEFLDAHRTMEDDVTAEGHLHTHGSCASVKDETLKGKTQITDYSREHIPLLRDNTSSKKKNIQVTPVSCNMDESLMVERYGRTIKCKEQDEDVTGLDARVGSASDPGSSMKFVLVPPDDGAGIMGQQYYESGPEHDESFETLSNHSHSEKVGAASPYYGSPLKVILPEQKPDMKSTRCHVVKPMKSVQADYKLYDVELAVEGTYKGHRAPLVSLTSKWNHKPVMGFPVPVVVLDDSCPVESRDNHHLAKNSLTHLLKRSEVAEPRQPRSSHSSKSKLCGRKKVSEHDMDKSWRPHTKKSASSPRKMRRLSSFGSSRRESANRNTVVRKIGGPTIACIPVRLVFSRINEALSFQVRSENTS
ncbi:uncharacterized protein LOC119276035 [Triticum dicoccoides]|uniref:uncharacterized protein LOC119276035 n=1 Tax=Triticum dicoccoides TaxID=85692 RepID=UPI000E787EE5|nr:uncharacterized protein LOC119276035 [Triticum dicoccoides]